MKSPEAQIDEIFWKASQFASAEKRSAYLDQACEDQPRLRAEVEKLLRAAPRAEHFLERPFVTPVAICQSVTEKPGALIGRYKLLQEIGEGGFGVVYMAEQQEPVTRKIALKIIKLGMDTRQVVARFEAERQALAMMDHPNIAKVHDAGATDTGRPYFVMELVRGTPITEYCDKNNLTINERLELFVDVCRAVQHAHQKGIIHRDIKPTNVMVALHDGRPVPKVIDFGIAKATQHRLTEKTLHTDYHQFIGTPQYMSPEQAQTSDVGVDTRTDIYSLGVLLYELLVGFTPFDSEKLRGAGYDEICRIIRDEDPSTPSRRLSTLGNAITEVSRHRRAHPTALRKLVRGDLDWIVMKSLEKDRNRRYESAIALALDIERHLSDEPVQARPPNTVYRLRKITRRHRAPLTVVITVFAALVIGLILTIHQRNRAETLATQLRQSLYASDTNRAYQAWEQGDVGRVAALLNRHQPQKGEEDIRGFEWHYLWGQYERVLETPTLQHDASLEAVAFSHDGKRLASASRDGTLKLWDLRDGTGTEPLTLEGHTASVLTVAFSPDDDVLASGSMDSTVRLWDVATGRVLAKLTGHLRWVWAVAFSPDTDNMTLASASADGTVRLLDIATGKERILSEHVLWVFSVAFSHDGQRLASCSPDGTVKLWHVVTGDELATLKGRLGMTSIAFSPDDRTLAAGSRDKTVRLWRAAVNGREYGPVLLRAPTGAQEKQDGTNETTEHQ